MTALRICTPSSAFLSVLLLGGLFIVVAAGCKSANTAVSGSSGSAKDPYRIAFYNVENFFDTEDDPLTRDEEFTPTGKLEWTPERYAKKVKNIGSVVAAVHPSVLGLCEVENRRVVEDLLKGTPALVAADYGICHYDSPDERGIDVALVYRKKDFRVISDRPIRVTMPPDAVDPNDAPAKPKNSNKQGKNKPVDTTDSTLNAANQSSAPKKSTRSAPTRDILFVDGIFGGKDTVSFYVNHWPSRRLGDKYSAPRRMAVARTLRRDIDSLLTVRPKAKIVIMGDFNDQPTDPSIAQGLRARDNVNATGNGDLFAIMYDLHLLDKGSYFYKGIWDMLDQIIVSPNLLTTQKGSLRAENPVIFEEDWIMFKHKDYGLLPNRTYGGKNYYGGYSDHLPIYLDMHR